MMVSVHSHSLGNMLMEYSIAEDEWNREDDVIMLESPTGMYTGYHDCPIFPVRCIF